MFGNLGAFVNGNMFMGLFGADVGLKLPDADREALLREDGAVIGLHPDASATFHPQGGDLPLHDRGSGTSGAVGKYSSPNATMYAPYTRKRTVMNAVVIGDVPVSSDHELLVKLSYPAVRIGGRQGNCIQRGIDDAYVGATGPLLHQR